MKWIAIHGTEVVGEFKREEDAKTYKEAADAAAFKVNIIHVDDEDYFCVIKMTGLYGYPDYVVYYRKRFDGFDFCQNIENATFFEGGRSNAEVQRILASSDWYLQQYNADKLEAVPFYQCTQQRTEED